MKVAVIGANTPVGARVVIEAEKAGIQVTSVVSTPADLVGNGPIIIKEAHELSHEDLSPFHAVVDAVTFPLMHTRALPELPVFYVAPHLAGSSCRYLGFGSCYLLYADSSRTRRVMDCKDMFYVRGELRAHKALEIYEKMQHIAGFNFTLLCPPLTVSEDAYATGSFALTDDILPMTETGSSSITLPDLALAMVELLKRQNLRGELIAVHNL